MFVIVKKIDHDTWTIRTNVNDDHGPKLIYAHSFQDLHRRIMRIADTFEWISGANTLPWYEKAHGNLYVSFDNEQDYIDNVWHIADIVSARCFRTKGRSAAYNF